MSVRMKSDVIVDLLLKPASTSLRRLRQLHARAAVSGLLSLHINLLFSAATATARPTPSHLRYALSLIPNPNTTFSINRLVRLHTLLSSPLAALRLFRRLRRPDFHSLPFALAACAKLGPAALPAAAAIHSQALKLAFDADPFLLNSLIKAYSAAGRLSAAVAAAADTRAPKDVVSYNTLIDALVKAGEVASARKLFDEMPLRDSISCATMVAGYARNGRSGEAIRLFFDMVEARIKPDNVAVVSALSACANAGDLDRGRAVHRYIHENRIRSDPFLATGLVDLYSRCGCIDTAREIFESSLSNKSVNLFTWNAMILGLAQHGLGELSLSYFRRMIAGAALKPDGATFLAVLVGCSHSGLVAEARALFSEMEAVHGVAREVKHYGCMADILGRAGLISEAAEMIEKMPMPGDVFVWGALLSGCRRHGDVAAAEAAAAEAAAARVMAVRPDDGGVYSVMAGVYAAAGQWEAVVRMKRSEERAAVRKSAAVSWVSVGGVRHEFVAWDRLHPQTDRILSLLNAIEKHRYEPFYSIS